MGVGFPTSLSFGERLCVEQFGSFQTVSEGGREEGFSHEKSDLGDAPGREQGLERGGCLRDRG